MILRTPCTIHPLRTLRTLKHIATARTIPSFRAAGRYPHASLVDRARQAEGLEQVAANQHYRHWKIAASRLRSPL
jgi:hypothetical protein